MKNIELEPNNMAQRLASGISCPHKINIKNAKAMAYGL